MQVASIGTPPAVAHPTATRLMALIQAGQATVGILGVGYVGLPLALTLAASGFKVIGFDVDTGRMATLNKGRSYLQHIPDDRVGKLVGEGLLEGTTDFGRCHEADVLIIAVPTPLTKHREPDLKYIRLTAEAIRPTLRPGQLVVLESTTYPGTTDEVLRPILERSGLKAGEDFFLAFSPEREDPGNPHFDTRTIPKVVGGDGNEARDLACAVYGRALERVVPVSSTQTAEAVKLTENIFRAVNIALVNELKTVFERMDIDVWEVIEAAKSKPFGFMPFYPGPGIGGHCIPIDPFYLTWKAREFDLSTRFIELAGQINTMMPYRIVDRVAHELDQRTSKGLNNARILVLGIAYKKDIGDFRESPALKLIDLLETRGAKVGFHDPYIEVFPFDSEHPHFEGRRSEALTAETVAAADVVLIATDHGRTDYALVAEHARLICDTRNVLAPRGLLRGNAFKA